MKLHTYKDDPVSMAMQKYLPKRNRLDEHTMPKEEWIEICDRFCVHVDHYTAEHPKGRILVLHGVGGNGRLLSFIAVPLWKEGYEVICPDLPLYGLTRYEGVVGYEDWNDIAQEIWNRYCHEDLPAYVFGLSAGGMLAYETASGVKNVQGLIVTCLLDQRIPTVIMSTSNNPLTAVLGKPLLKLIHKPLGKIRIPMKSVCAMDQIVNHKEVCDLLLHDPLSSGSSVSLEFLYGMLNPVLNKEPEEFDRCPVLFVQPSEDRWTKEEISRLFLDRIASDVIIARLPGAGHFPIEEEGLTVLESSIVSFIKSTSLTAE